MSRGYGWWGAPPLAAGAVGLLLLAFGAKGMRGDDEINGPARLEAERVESQLNDAEQRRDAVRILLEEETTLKEHGKSVDLLSLVPKKGEVMSTEQAAEARQRILAALSEPRDAGTAFAGRVAFYAGLVLLFGAGVLLYRRTPESGRGAW